MKHSGKTGARAGKRLNREAIHRFSGHGHGTMARAGRGSDWRREMVDARQLQSAFLLVLILYASMALVNWGSEMTALVQQWRSLVEFVAGGLPFS